MADSQMLNFRVRSEDVVRIDATAKKLSMNRSDFIKRALTEAIARYSGDETPITSLPGRGKAASKDSKKKTPFPGCPRAAQCSLTKLPTGIKVCGTCNAKFSPG